jgi:hypothetical protein
LAANELRADTVADVLRASGVECGATDTLASTAVTRSPRGCSDLFRVGIILFDRATTRRCRANETHTEPDRERAPDSKFFHEPPPSW